MAIHGFEYEVNFMKMKSHTEFWVKIFAVGTLIGVLLFFITVMDGLLAWNSPAGIQKVVADSHLGILGQQAPDLNLNTWINADGKKIDPIQLSAYRGKVIYLYFWQDW